MLEAVFLVAMLFQTGIIAGAAAVELDKHVVKESYNILEDY